MKIGFSLGRCVRDIVSGDVGIDDVAFIITATSIHSREQIENVIYMYGSEPRYLLGFDLEKCVDVAHQLWDTNRLIQPRKQGLHRHMQPESSVWVDIFPTSSSNNDSVKKAWDAYRFMLHMVENVDTEATEVFKT
jgi:glutamate synthase domain-containing protein 1